ncbi:lysine-rich arabinogalactan protein 18-like [Papilio machaon]|uniref:lysine-rich arabinogalactan protein 18-like n=1 Tax=Papilio machaon TaxID=76193 RepID=UPI001E6649FD|nr:lysine-rich arabinogalactan protein 18-like [Papilio machaon]
MADQSLVGVLDFLRAKFPDAFKALTASLLESESGAPAVPPKSLDSTPSTTDTEEMELDSPLSPENPDDAGGLFTEVRNKKKRKKRSSPAPSSASSSSRSPVPQKAPRPCPQLEPGSSQPVQIPALMAIPVEATQPPSAVRSAPPAARALLDKKPPPI